MARTGVVISIENERALVSTTLKGVCGECSDEGCAMHIGSTPVPSEVVVVNNIAGARIGDTVEMELPGHTELGVSMLVWIIPMIGLIGGAAIGVALHGPLGVEEDSAALVGMVLGFFAAITGLKIIDGRARGHRRLVPNVTKVLPPASCAPGNAPAVDPADSHHAAPNPLALFDPPSTPRR